MLYVVLVRLDESGAGPVILREDSDPLRREEGVRYRFVAQTDDPVEAVRVAELVKLRFEAGER